MDLIVTSSVAGRRRGGGQFTGATKLDPAKFTAVQLKEIMNDPALTLVYGTVVTADDVAETLAEAQAVRAAAVAEAEKAAAAAAKKPAAGAKT